MIDIVAIFINKFIRRPVIKKRLEKVGDNFRLGFSSIITGPKKISIGHNFFTGPFFYISTNDDTSIKIGNDVMFGPDCKVIAGNHNMSWTGGHMMFAPKNRSDKGIVIESGVWVGANATILDGACISEGAVIAAGAVVSSYVPPYVIGKGVPAKRFKARFDKGGLQEILENTASAYSLDQVLKIYKKYEVIVPSG